MTSTPTNSMLLLPPSAFQSTLSFHSNHENDHQTTVHEQLEQLQLEMGRLRTNNEALKISGRGNENIHSFVRRTFFSFHSKIYLTVHHH